MAVLEVQIGCYIEVIDSLWPDYIRSRLLAEDADATSQALAGDAVATSQASAEDAAATSQASAGGALRSGKWLAQKNLVTDVLSKARPFLERNSKHRTSMNVFFENPPRELFPPSPIT